MSQYLVSIFTIQLILGSTWQVDIGLLLPRLLVGEEGGTFKLLFVGLTYIIATGTQLKHIFDLLVVKTGGIIDIAVRTADGNDLRT